MDISIQMKEKFLQCGIIPFISVLFMLHLNIVVHDIKKQKIGFDIYHSPNLSTCVLEPYNTLLATHLLLNYTEVSLLLDNNAIYGICQKQFRIAKPDLDNLNKLISKVISAMTSSLRFSGELNVDLNEFQTNLPFPSFALHDYLNYTNYYKS
ncbi:tubulin alpha-3 chain [Reticulomyxa filosa]|uniref:Tubulin alpha-3 chain n=1 Tax=Reticulomyxa filosa TaxID=46433 RepID=X6MPC5_RETFI|nr:tubulin alpha-3 chain [Reticulomyxa filosa]|eukprot:ETO14905.1 tubulin alpha-3 chain [Reticulomyxa filosa]